MADDNSENDNKPEDSEASGAAEGPAPENEEAADEAATGEGSTDEELNLDELDTDTGDGTGEGLDNLDTGDDSDEAEEEDLISLDDLDSLLAEEDPEFAAGINEIAEDSELASADVQSFDSVEVEKIEPKKPFLDRHPKLKKYLTPVLFLIKFLRPLIAKIIQAIKDLKKAIINYFKKDFWKHLRFLSSNGKDFGFFLFKYLRALGLFFKGLSWRQRIGILVASGFLYGVGLFVKTVVEEQGWIPVLGRPLITSFELGASDIMEYDKEADLVKFYLAFPQPAFTVLMDKMVINLRRPHIEANPFASMEFYVNADSQATAVEIRDRQKELIALLRRALEDLTYKEVVTMSGKARVRNIVKNEMNRILNLGRVDEVFIKNLVAKP